MKNTIIFLAPLLYCLLSCNTFKDANSSQQDVNKLLIDRSMTRHFVFGDPISSKLSVALDSVEMNFVIDTLGQGVYLQVHRVVINSDRNKTTEVYSESNEKDSVASVSQSRFAQNYSTEVVAAPNSSLGWIVLVVAIMITLIILRIKFR